MTKQEERDAASRRQEQWLDEPEEPISLDRLYEQMYCRSGEPKLVPIAPRGEEAE